MYYLAIIYFTFAYFVGFDFSNLDWSNLPKKELILNLFFINGFFPEYIHHYVPGGWSITVEFTFYAIFPLLFSKIKTINSTLVFTLITLLFSTAVYLLLEGTNVYVNEFLKLYFIAQLPVFSLGMLAYRIVTGKITEVKLSSLAFLAVVVLAYCYITVPYDFAYSLVFFLLLVLLTQKQYLLFSNKILAKIGKVSFSLYLMHFVILTVFNRFACFKWVDIADTPSAYLYFSLGYLCLFVVAFICSNITYQFIEVLGQNLGRKLIKKLDQQK